ncbi:MAG: hypothetical protein JXR37_00450 [Kiritimatiellae bacterium]|nr:hypothetical protein [Kiritimatiellia bacterium]
MNRTRFVERILVSGAAVLCCGLAAAAARESDQQTAPSGPGAEGAGTGSVAGQVGAAVLPAFPGAEGFGAIALNTSRKLPVVVHQVTNTNDSGPGSLRQAVADCRADRYDIITFRTGGVIDVEKEIQFNKPNIRNIYIAGQTAPGDGIYLTARKTHRPGVFFQYGTEEINNIVVRYIKFRLANPRPKNRGGRAFMLTAVNNFLMDHCSISWNSDDLMAIRVRKTSVKGVTHSITVQRTVFAETITGHLTGLGLGGPGEIAGAHSVHHNIFSTISHRLPSSGPLTLEVINNVYYNYGRTGDAYGGGTIDYIANYYRVGPRWPNPNGILFRLSDEFPSHIPTVYMAGNMAPHFGITSPTQDNWALTENHSNWDTWNEPAMRRSSPVSAPPVPVTVQTAKDAYTSVLADSGANARLDDMGNWVSNRDSVDKRIIAQIQNGTGLDRLMTIDDIDFPNVDPGTPYPDTDQDGMADVWERKHFGDLARDGSEITGSGYLAIECFLNGTDPTRR